MREDVFYRLLNWQYVLAHALRNLGIAEHLSEHGAKTYETVEIAGTSFQTIIAIEAQQGLHETAIIGFRQVFALGHGTADIAANDDPDIRQIRERMEQHSIQTLGLPNAEYETLMDEIKCQRNELVAHYDATAADYRRLNPSVTAMKMAGCLLRPPQIDLLAKIIRTMQDFTHQEIMALLTAR